MPDAPAHRRRLAPAWLPVAAFVLLTLPLLLMGESGHSEAADQRLYHLPVIEQFAGQLPAPDLVHYDSATAPGYHLLTAVVHRVTGGSLRAMILVTWLFGLLLVVVAGVFTARLVPARRAGVLVLPLACSSYTVGGATALSTDNASVALAGLAVGGAVLLPWKKTTALWLSLASLGAVAVRQIFVWSIAPIGLAGLLASPLGTLAPRALRTDREDRSWADLLVAIGACAVPVALVAVFALLWGGLVPDSANEQITKHSAGPNPATFAYAFALLGVFATPYAVLAGATLRELLSRSVLVMSSIALVCSLAVPTSFMPKERAYGWFWQMVVQRAPDVAERSLAITILAVVGGGSVALLWRGAVRARRAREAIALGLTSLGWLLAQSLNTMAWQKYFEQIMLLFVAWACALALSAHENAHPRWRWALLWALIAFQFLFSAAKFYRQAILDMR